MARSEHLWTVGAALSLAAMTQAHGEEQRGSEPSAAEPVEEVVVSAPFYRPEDSTSSTKFSLPVFDTPQAVSVVTSDTLEKFQAANTDEIYRFVSGLTPQADLPTEQTPIMSRGFKLSGLYGYKVNDVSAYRLFPIDAVAVERIEAVKGPSGVIFGRNDYGGVLNTKTKMPLQTAMQSASFSRGSYGFKRVEADVSQPIGDGRLRVRIPLAWEEGNDVTGGRDRSLTAAAPSLAFSIDERTELEMLAVLQSNSDNYPIGFPAYTPDRAGPAFSCTSATVRCTAPPDSLRDVHSALPWNEIDMDGSMIIGSVSRRVLEDSTLRLALGYNKTESLWRQSFLYGSIGSSGNAYQFADRVWFEEVGKTAELGLSGNLNLFGREHAYYVGVDWASSRRNVESTDDPYLGVIDLYDYGAPSLTDALFQMPNFQINSYDHSEADYLGIGAQILPRLTERLSMLLGVRWEKADTFLSRARTEVEQEDPTLGGRGASVLDDQSNTSVIPRVGLIWSLVPEQLNTYVSYSEGYRPQSSVTRDGNFIDPEEGRQWEIGLKAQLFDNRLAMSLAAYDIERSNVAVNDPANSPNESYVVPGLEQNHRGVEFEAVGQPLRGLNVIAQVAYLDAKGESTLPVRLADGTLVNRPPTYVPASVPEVSGGLFLLYQFHTGRLQGLSLGAGASHTGSVWANNANTFKLPGFTTADASVSYRTQNWEFTLAGKNLFDEVYVVGGGNAEFNLQFGNARTVIAKFRYLLQQ